MHDYNRFCSIHHGTSGNVWVSSEGATIEPIKLIHRANDGVVTFHSKSVDGRFENLAAVRRDRLTVDAFDRVAPKLDTGGFFSINGFYRTGFGDSQHCPGLKSPTTKSKHLRYLNATAADIDCYKLDISPGEALGRMVDLEDSGELPPVSMYIRSGRGVWALWLLEDEDTGVPPRYWPESAKTYAGIQRRINEIVAPIGGDPHALDASRLTRVPGTINPRSGERVRYMTQAREGGGVFRYGLAEMAALLGVKTGGPDVRNCGHASDPRRSEQGRAGRKALGENRVRQIRSLDRTRGGFRKGMRSHACLLYAAFLRGLGTDDTQIAREVTEMGSRCRPPMSGGKIRDAIKGSASIAKVRNQLISDWLEVTPEESVELETWSAATRFGISDDPSLLTQSERTEKRRLAIDEIIGNGPRPTVRVLQSELGELGIGAALSTIHNDIKCLGSSRVDALGAVRSPVRDSSGVPVDTRVSETEGGGEGDPPICRETEHGLRSVGEAA